MINNSIVFLIVLAIVTCNSGCTVYHKIRLLPEINHKFPVGENSVTYIGHATVLVHLDSLNIITDPLFSNYLGGWFAKRYVEPGIKFERMPSIDMILISHNHWDHLDKSTLKRFSKDIPVIISKELGEKVRNLGFSNVIELDWWENTEINNVKITAVPSEHDGTNPTGFIIEYNNKIVYFAGDTGLSDYFNEIGTKFRIIDVAILPIGDYRPEFFLRKDHLSPEDIPSAIGMLNPKMVIPIHWGTFKISVVGLNEPIDLLNEVIKENKLDSTVSILKHGEQKIF